MELAIFIWIVGTGISIGIEHGYREAGRPDRAACFPLLALVGWPYLIGVEIGEIAAKGHLFLQLESERDGVQSREADELRQKIRGEVEAKREALEQEHRELESRRNAIEERYQAKNLAKTIELDALRRQVERLKKNQYDPRRDPAKNGKRSRKNNQTKENV